MITDTVSLDRYRLLHLSAQVLRLRSLNTRLGDHLKTRIRFVYDHTEYHRCLKEVGLIAFARIIGVSSQSIFDGPCVIFVEHCSHIKRLDGVSLQVLNRLCSLTFVLLISVTA